VSKFSSSGSLIWGTYFGKGGYPKAGGVALGVAVDKKGGIYVGGRTCHDKNISTSDAFQPAIGGANQYGDGFLIKFDKTGNRVWGTYIGGTASDGVNAVTTDGDDAVWVTGSLESQNNAVTAGSYQPLISANSAAFITKFNSSGVRQSGTYYGVTQPNWYSGEGMGIAYAGEGNVFVTGQTSADKGIATCNAVQKQLARYGDAFIAKFGESSQPIVPSVSITTDHTATICPGTSVLFTAKGQAAGNMPSYQWLINGLPKPGNSSTITLNGLAEGDQVECILDVNSTCTAGQFKSNIITVHLDPALPPSAAISTPSTTVCPAALTSFTAQGTNEGADPSYQWTVDGFNAGENSPTFATSTLSSGNVVSCILTHHGSCIKDSVAKSNPIAISVLPAPDVKASISASAEAVCSGTVVEFAAAASGSPGLQYQWQLNGQPVGTNNDHFSSERVQNGDMIVCLVNANDGVCSFPAVKSNSIIETVNPIPEITITGEHSIVKGQTVQLNASVSPAPEHFTWTPDSTLTNAATLMPVANPKETTIYDLKVFSDKGCEAEKTFVIEVIPRIVIPDAFTPNSDGKNDVFRGIYGSDISHVHLAVFDRWGRLVFEDNGSHKTWDGSFDGKMLSAGTYAWIFKYTDAAGTARVLKGTVLLIK
jgi:gliding motility-associated-like protein